MAEEKEKAAEKPRKHDKGAKSAAKSAADAGAPAAASAAGDPSAAAAAPDAEGAKPVVRKHVKGAKNVPLGIVHVRASFNNTGVTITDMKGAVIAWSTSGRCGFKGSRKSTAYAASMVATEAARQAAGQGMREVEVHMQGPGVGRESVVRAIQAAGINVTLIKDVTPVPHNGCRPPKRRRV